MTAPYSELTLLAPVHERGRAGPDERPPAVGSVPLTRSVLNDLLADIAGDDEAAGRLNRRRWPCYRTPDTPMTRAAHAPGPRGDSVLVLSPSAADGLGRTWRLAEPAEVDGAMFNFRVLDRDRWLRYTIADVDLRIAQLVIGTQPEVQEAFRSLAGAVPDWTLDLLEHGVDLWGQSPYFGWKDALSRGHYLPLLQADYGDTRARAVSLLRPMLSMVDTESASPRRIPVR